MTEQEKQEQLALLELCAQAAERSGNNVTAKSFRDHAAVVAARPAAEMVLVKRQQSKPANPV